MPRRSKKHKLTPFERMYGMTSEQFAKMEGISPQAVHMRKYKYGSPFKRAEDPNIFELKYGLTVIQIADMLNISADAVRQREEFYGTPFIITKKTQARNPFNRDDYGGAHYKGWLHPLHPDYPEWEAACRERIATIRWVFVKDLTDETK